MMEPNAGNDIDRLEIILRSLNEASRDIDATIVVSSDGLPMMTKGESVDPDKVGGICAALLSAGRAGARELQRGTSEEVLVKGTEGYVLVAQAGPNAALVILVRPNVNLGLIFLEARRAADAIAAAL